MTRIYISSAGPDSWQQFLVVPEHKVPLPGGRTESQNDVFVLGSTPSGLVSICVEGKVNESFGEPVAKWGPESSPGKQIRFQYLTEVLELEGKDLSNIYYQLLHRTASAIIEAKRFHATTAIMLVHSFSQEHRWFPEYLDFAAKFDVDAPLKRIYHAGKRSGVDLYLGWIVGNPEYLER